MDRYCFLSDIMPVVAVVGNNLFLGLGLGSLTTVVGFCRGGVYPWERRCFFFPLLHQVHLYTFTKISLSYFSFSSILIIIFLCFYLVLSILMLMQMKDEQDPILFSSQINCYLIIVNIKNWLFLVIYSIFSDHDLFFCPFL